MAFVEIPIGVEAFLLGLLSCASHFLVIDALTSRRIDPLLLLIICAQACCDEHECPADAFALQAKNSLQMPPPLQIPPSRARRQFAARLAQRKAELAATKEEEADEDEGKGGMEVPGERKETEGGAERFSNLFEGIEDTSSEEDDAEDKDAGPD